MIYNDLYGIDEICERSNDFCISQSNLLSADDIVLTELNRNMYLHIDSICERGGKEERDKVGGRGRGRGRGREGEGKEEEEEEEEEEEAFTASTEPFFRIFAELKYPYVGKIIYFDGQETNPVYWGAPCKSGVVD
ncbi:hypothetical protein V1478_009262 [Vespula squamosa]|uniref:Uncharacterized protein n=1 Tax=Vespula squamosa TaxID=30214 RepID=A0ABD2AP47_VESSQ